MAPPHVALSVQDADEKYKAAHKRLVLREGTVALKFGSMYLAVPTVRVMFVFTKEDAQYSALKWAAEKMHYECLLSSTAEAALENFLDARPHLVFIDARSKNTVDPIVLCRTLGGYKWSQYSCIVAVVKRGLADREEAAIIPLLRAGYNRWLLETSSPVVCLNEMVQIEHNDLVHLWKLMASEALFSALHYARDGIIVTGPSHEIQFMNRAAEKLAGFSAEEMLGENAQELHRTDFLKPDVASCIKTQLENSHEWVGTLFHRRKSGECVPVWSKVAPVDMAGPGKLDHVVYIKESPFLLEKPFSPDAVVMSRKQAFAKYHAMALEAPITKVVNMLLATKQENCPASVAQSLDDVLDILRCTELYNPQLGAGQDKAEDQMTSDLVAGLTGDESAVHRSPRGRAKSLCAWRAVGPADAVSVVKAPMVAVPAQLSLTAAPSKIKDLLENDVKWEFDIIDLEALTGRRPLIWLGLSIFTKLNVHTSLECDDATIRNWLQLIEANYQDNPYHNSTHAGDVMQATAYFLLKLRKKDIFDPLDEAICLISAVIHDVDHPGKSSPFLCNSDHELAILYNDRTVLESHHAALGFKLTLSDERVNIFANLERDVYRSVRTSIIDMVLATEMTKHFEHLSKFLNAFQKPMQETEAYDQEAFAAARKALVYAAFFTWPHCFHTQPAPERGETFSLRSQESILLIKRMLIKCADVSNPARPIELCIQWAQRIAEEYCEQTDEEKRRGLPVVMPAFDRAICNIAKSQTGFIAYFVRDMFRAWSDFGEFPELNDYIEKNFIYWKDKEPVSA